jgi:hypothetical protein
MRPVIREPKILAATPSERDALLWFMPRFDS